MTRGCSAGSLALGNERQLVSRQFECSRLSAPETTPCGMAIRLVHEWCSSSTTAVDVRLTDTKRERTYDQENTSSPRISRHRGKGAKKGSPCIQFFWAGTSWRIVTSDCPLTRLSPMIANLEVARLRADILCEIVILHSLTLCTTST